MSVFLHLTLAAVVAAMLQSNGEPACRPPQVSDFSLRLWADNTAIIHSQKKQGFGLVVAWTPGRAWIAAPSHILYEPTAARADAPLALLEGLSITLASDPTPRKLCQPNPGSGPFRNPTPADTTLDLAFVCVEWHGQPLFWQSLVARTIEPGADLLLYTPSLERIAGRIADANDSSEKTIVVNGLNGAEGMSGLWVASPAGVIGIYEGTGGGKGDGTGGRVLTVTAIKDNADQSQVPWELTANEAFDCRRKRRVCFQPSTKAPGAIALRNVRGFSYSLTNGTCLDIAEEKYIVTDSSNSMLCEPGAISIYADQAPLQLPLTCEPNLSGEWRSANGHVLTCVASLSPSLRTAQCYGLQTLGLGVLQGTLRRDNERLVLSGLFNDPTGLSYQAEGSFEWRAGRLDGEITRVGFPPVTLSLTRSVAP